jgi:hypothetical protein
MNIQTIPASAAPEALTTAYFMRSNPAWDAVQHRILDSKRGKGERYVMFQWSDASPK